MSYLIPRILNKTVPGHAKFMFGVQGYNKYGLYNDDIIGGYNNTNDPTTAEAVRRLLLDKPELYDQRVFRSLRAIQLKIQKKYLPENEWTTYDDDETKGRYLQPYLDEIAREENEKKNFSLLD